MAPYDCSALAEFIFMLLSVVFVVVSFACLMSADRKEKRARERASSRTGKS